MADDPPPTAGFLGQLLLELPPDSWLPESYISPVAPDVLAEAQRLQILLRDINGKVY